MQYFQPIALNQVWFLVRQGEKFGHLWNRRKNKLCSLLMFDFVSSIILHKSTSYIRMTLVFLSQLQK